MDDRIAQIRNFNRVITRRLGALDSSFLGCGVSLGKARLLFEIGAGVTEVRRLRAELDLDSGQMSRMLRSLENRGLIETTVDTADGRARIVALTKAGKAKLNQLDRKSNEGAQSWLTPLSPGRQAQLQAAMEEVVRILKASEVSIEPEDPRSDAAVWCLNQFFRELDRRFEAGFDPGRTTSASAAEMTPPNGYFLLATLPDQPVGCAALKLSEGGKIGEVKRMWVSEEVRGLGIGRRLLESVEARARKSGVELLRLETNKSLTEAQTLYRASGFQEVALFDDEPYAHLAFEKRLS
jgi:DNA-binding MarR family transcriptional regulator/predicted GNAT family N-acyltransferase